MTTNNSSYVLDVFLIQDNAMVELQQHNRYLGMIGIKLSKIFFIDLANNKVACNSNWGIVCVSIGAVLDCEKTLDVM